MFEAGYTLTNLLGQALRVLARKTKLGKVIFSTSHNLIC